MKKVKNEKEIKTKKKKTLSKKKKVMLMEQFYSYRDPLHVYLSKRVYG